MESNFDIELRDEVTKRLAEMEEPGYEFPERMRKADFVVAGVIMAIALVVTEVATQMAGVM